MDKRDTLLLAGGSAGNRAVLRDVFKESYNLLEAESDSQAILLLGQNRDCIAAVLLDITAPEKLRQELLRQPEARRLLEDIPAIVVVDRELPETLAVAFGLGAMDVISLSYDPYAMRQRVHTIVELHLHKRHLEELVEEQAAEMRHTNERMVDALSSIIEHRSAESGLHILRIRRFTQILLEEVADTCPEYGLTEAAVKLIASAAALHDIGKISVPDSVLNKPDTLTPEERAVMQTHALAGCSILESLSDLGDPEYLRYAHNICHYHHERWDGGGYPEGLVGDATPICAQVVGLADAYDALTSKRVYKEAVALDTAANMILNGECGLFSPKLLECFKHAVPRFEELARRYGDGFSPKSERFDVELPPPSGGGENVLDTVRAKYLALMHYVNAFVAEVDVDRGLYHLIYNPYPELAVLSDANSLEETVRLVSQQIVIAEDRERLLRLLREDIPAFLTAGLRRKSEVFRVCAPDGGSCGSYEVTLLRTNFSEPDRRRLLIIWRRLDGAESREGGTQIQPLAGVCWFSNDEGCTLESGSTELTRLVGWTHEELHRNFGGRLMELVVREDRAAVREEMRRQLTLGRDLTLECRMHHRDGRIVWALIRSRLTVGTDGREYLFTVLTDVSAARRSYEMLREKIERYEIILAQTENVLFEWDLASDGISFSETWEQLFGFVPISENVTAALTGGSYFHPDDMPLLLRGISDLHKGAQYRMVEIRIATGSGRYLWCRFRATALRGINGQLEKIVGIIINIDSEKRAEQQLQDRAERDALTRLLNKQATVQRTEEQLSLPDARCAVLIIDLDNFKQVNDRYGHMFGDAVLTQAAREIRKLFRAQDIVGRIGGDEFMVVMCDVSDRALVESRCKVLLELFRSLFREQPVDCLLGCSIGVALAPEHGHSYPELFLHADQALYEAKRRGKNGFVFYDAAHAQSPHWRKYMTSVNTRIDSDEQPGLADGSIVQYAFQKLYSSQDTEAAINEILAMIGQQMNVSRAYIFENTPDNLCCNNTFEWCNTGIEPQIHNLQNISYQEDIPGYIDLYDEHGLVCCQDITTLPEEVYNILAPQSIKSLLHCAILDKGVFRGYIGFDECATNRLWTQEQVDALSFLSEMLAIFLLKKRAQEEIAQRASDLRSILDNQDAWIYVIDPDSCRLRFLNASTRELAPSVEEGDYCYRSLMGRSERCVNCPAADIRRTRNARRIMVNDKYGLRVNAEATLISWSGQEACLLTCRRMEPDAPPAASSQS